MTFFSAALLVILGTLIGAWGALFFKLAASESGGSLKEMIFNLKFLLGAVLYVVSTIPFLIAVKHTQVTAIYPIVATSYIWTIILARLFLREKITGMKWLGILCIIIGVVFISLGK